MQIFMVAPPVLPRSKVTAVDRGNTVSASACNLVDVPSAGWSAEVGFGASRERPASVSWQILKNPAALVFF